MQPPVWATALLLGLGLGLAVGAKIIQLPHGGVSVHGGTCTAGEVEVDSFFSIPYAEPPVGALRWAAPRPWSASKCSHSSGGGGSGGGGGVVINATVPAPACIQFGSEFAEAGPQSEDW